MKVIVTLMVRDDLDPPAVKRSLNVLAIFRFAPGVLCLVCGGFGCCSFSFFFLLFAVVLTFIYNREERVGGAAGDLHLLPLSGGGQLGGVLMAARATQPSQG